MLEGNKLRFAVCCNKFRIFFLDFHYMYVAIHHTEKDGDWYIYP